LAYLKIPDEPTSDQLLFIQGLRGLAVVLVIAFHVGLPVLGGFIGVDVFFVISGYVITLSLIRRLSKGGLISLTSFYLARFRRLAPALALMVTFTTLVSAAIFFHLAGAETTGQTGLAAMLGLANIVIVRVSGGYFEPA
jgi:peptidoglycan/LPS O-acetylase OafA/YrhL